MCWEACGRMVYSNWAPRLALWVRATQSLGRPPASPCGASVSPSAQGLSWSAHMPSGFFQMWAVAQVCIQQRHEIKASRLIFGPASFLLPLMLLPVWSAVRKIHQKGLLTRWTGKTRVLKHRLSLPTPGRGWQQILWFTPELQQTPWQAFVTRLPNLWEKSVGYLLLGTYSKYAKNVLLFIRNSKQTGHQIVSGNLIYVDPQWIALALLRVCFHFWWVWAVAELTRDFWDVWVVRGCPPLPWSHVSCSLDDGLGVHPWAPYFYFGAGWAGCPVFLYAPACGAFTFQRQVEGTVLASTHLAFHLTKIIHPSL